MIRGITIEGNPKCSEEFVYGVYGARAARQPRSLLCPSTCKRFLLRAQEYILFFFFFFFTKRVRTFSVFYKVRASSAPWAVCGGLLKSKTNPNAAAD